MSGRQNLTQGLTVWCVPAGDGSPTSSIQVGPEPPNQAAGCVVLRVHTRARVQSGARDHGIGGIHDNGGNLESATYRIYRVVWSSNPTLSESHTSSGTAPSVYLSKRTFAGKPDKKACSPT